VASGGTATQGQFPGQPGTIYFAPSRLVSFDTEATPICVGGEGNLTVAVQGADQTGFAWRGPTGILSNGPTPWGSIISGANSDTLTISNTQPQDAGIYRAIAETECGPVEGEEISFEVFCGCQLSNNLQGSDDNFAAPPEMTQPSQSLLDARAALIPDDPIFPIYNTYAQFDEVPVTTPGLPSVVVVAHTFTGLPSDIVGAKLHMRAKVGAAVGSYISLSPPFFNNGLITFSFADGSGANATRNGIGRVNWTDVPFISYGSNVIFERGLFSVAEWQPGFETLVTIDLAASDPSIGLEFSEDPIAAINANGFLDVVSVGTAGIDFMSLEIETSDGTTTTWIAGFDDQLACPGETASFSVQTGDLGGPFNYQWRRDGLPIDTMANPSAATDTLVLDPVQPTDFGVAFDCELTGANACGIAISDPVFLLANGCLLGDIDGDGDVDFDDLDALTAVLLDAPLDPNHVPASDLNDDGTADGRDIGLFVQAIAGP